MRETTGAWRIEQMNIIAYYLAFLADKFNMQLCVNTLSSFLLLTNSRGRGLADWIEAYVEYYFITSATEA